MSKSKKRLNQQLRAAKKQIAEFSMDATTQTSPSAIWANPFNEFGESDPTINTTWMPPFEFTFQELVNLYQNPLCYRIVMLHAEDGTRNGFELTSKDDMDLARDIDQQMTEEYNWLAIGTKAIAQRHQFGGSAIYVDVEDGRDDEEPLNENGVREVLSYQPVESFYAQPFTSNPSRGERNPGQPIHYKITLQSMNRGDSFTCHASRIIRFPSFESDDVIAQNERIRRRTWPFSTIQRIYDMVKRYGIGMQSESQLLQGFVEDVFKVSNLNVIKDLEGANTYLQSQRLQRNSLKGTVMGKDDDLQKLSTPTTGLSEITADQRRDAGMVSGIPVPILFSEESGDLGGSTLSESRKVWHDSIRPKQRNQYTPMYWKMMWFKSLEMKEWDLEKITGLEWNPLESISPKEQAELENLQAETDKIYVQELGLSEADVLEARIGSGQWSAATAEFDKDEFEKELEEDEAEEKELQEKQFEAINDNEPEEKPEKNTIVLEDDE